MLRVEATGLCHSDIDHFRGHVHTPWGGAFPSIPGHEIVGRIEKIDPAAAAAWGVNEGDRVAVCELVVTPDGYRIYGHDFAVDEGSGLYGGFAEHLELLPGFECVPPPRGPLRRGAHRLRAVELCDHMGGTGQAGRRRLIEGPGHMGMATIVAARAAGASTVIVTGVSRDKFRLDCALQVGADHVIDVESEDPIEGVREITGGQMADVVIDAAAGNPVTVNLAMDLVRKGGHVVIAGMKDRPLEGFHSDWIPTRRITLHPGAGLDTGGAARSSMTARCPPQRCSVRCSRSSGSRMRSHC